MCDKTEWCSGFLWNLLSVENSSFIFVRLCYHKSSCRSYIGLVWKFFLLKFSVAFARMPEVGHVVMSHWYPVHAAALLLPDTLPTLGRVALA